MPTTEQIERQGAFLHEIADVCRKHNLSLTHEDFQGAFLVEEFTEQNLRWLMAARWED